MYVCMYVCIYVCMYAYILHIRVCIPIKNVCIEAYTQYSMYVYVCMQIHTRCSYLHSPTCIFVHPYTHVYTLTHKIHDSSHSCLTLPTSMVAEMLFLVVIPSHTHTHIHEHKINMLWGLLTWRPLDPWLQKCYFWQTQTC